MHLPLFLLLFTLAAPTCLCSILQKTAAVGELFTYKIEPLLFNWTHQIISEQYRFRPTLAGYPDLPSWLRYMYSREYNAGFLYGTPPERLAQQHIELDIVGLNRQNYETREVLLQLVISNKFPAPNVIQMKIDNLNWVHFMDPGRVENLRNIFRNELWPESANDINLVFMESAVNMGGRVPLKPQQHEGVIVHLGSFASYSARLKELQEEVKPLYKLSTCSYKRTSVQKIFENAGFKLDWCAFRLVAAETTPELLFHNMDNNSKGSTSGGGNSESSNLKRTERWIGMAKDEVPMRNYIDEFAFSLAIPGVIFALLMGMLSIILCFQHEKFVDPVSEYFFENIFHICEEYLAAKTAKKVANETESIEPYVAAASSTVQMVQCSDTNPQPVTTLKSLKDPNCLLENASLRSQSPNFYPIENAATSYLRPKPPPYKGGTLNRNGVDSI